MKFNTKVNGIPCICHVIYYKSAKYGVHEEFEYTLLDRKGYRAEWLDVYVTYEVEQRFLKEYHEQ